MFFPFDSRQNVKYLNGDILESLEKCELILRSLTALFLFNICLFIQNNNTNLKDLLIFIYITDIVARRSKFPFTL